MKAEASGGVRARQMRTGEHREASGGEGGRTQPPRQDDTSGRGTVCLSFLCPPSTDRIKCFGLDRKPQGYLTRVGRGRTQPKRGLSPSAETPGEMKELIGAFS